MIGMRTDMSYRFKAGDKDAQAAIRRVALSQVDGALSKIGDTGLPAEQLVHEVRKHCKKLRALIRLVRPALAVYDHENAAFRDMARTLGSARDRDVLILTCDHVSAHYGARADRSAILGIRDRLIREREEAAGNGQLRERLNAFAQAMAEARERAAGWTLDADGFDAFAEGLADTLRRARKAMKAAKDDPAAENLHQWRKGVKYHWYHSRLLRGIWPGPMDAHIKAASEVADLLGAHHDLAVLRQTLENRPSHFGDPKAVHDFAGLVAKREKAAEKKAFKLGGLLLAEKPKALGRRWEACWRLWRGED